MTRQSRAWVTDESSGRERERERTRKRKAIKGKRVLHVQTFNVLENDGREGKESSQKVGWLGESSWLLASWCSW